MINRSALTGCGAALPRRPPRPYGPGMEIDLTGLPWWATVLIGLVLLAVLVSVSTALWWVIWKVMFGRWYRALVSVALLVVAVVLGVPGRVWAVVQDGWGENGWVMLGVALLVGAPIAALAGVFGDGLMSGRSSGAPVRTAREQEAYNWTENQRARDIDQRRRSGGL